MRSVQAFTLAELLIALAILGVIATFTIPKVLGSQQNSQYNAEAKEAFSMVSGAYQAYQQANGGPSSGMKTRDLSAYMNYVAVDTVSNIDDAQTLTTVACSVAGRGCMVLHNGGRLYMDFNEAFGGTASTSAITFWVDPDGKVTDGTTNGPGKALKFHLYYSGRITTRGNTEPNTMSTGYTYASPVPAYDPPWFSWN